MDVYMKTHAIEFINGDLKYIDLNDELRAMLDSIIVDLYISEPRYLYDLKESYVKLREELLYILNKLTMQLDY
jgi:hypothetical protein